MRKPIPDLQCTLCVLLLAASAAGAQSTVAYEPAYGLSWPDTTGAFERVLLGPFLSGGANDAVVLRSGTLSIAVDPSGYDLVVQPTGAPTGVVDVATLPGTDPTYVARILFTDASGLHSTTIDASTLTFAPATLEQASWAGASLLRTVDLDGLGAVDVLGAAASTALLRVDSGAASPTWTSVSFSATLIDLTAGDYDGDGIVELGGLTTTGVEFRRRSDGALLKSWPMSGTNGRLTSIPRLGSTTSSVVAAIDPAANGQWLLFRLDLIQRALLGALRTDIPGSQPLQDVGVQPSSLLAQDVDGDADVDLLVANASYATAFAVLNAGVNPGDPFTTSGDQIVWELAPDPSTTTSGVSGEHELAWLRTAGAARGTAIPVDATNALYLIPEFTTVQSPATVPLVNQINYTFTSPGTYDPDSAITRNCSLRFQVLTPSDLISAGHDKLAVTVWKADAPEALLNPTPVLARQIVFDLDGWTDPEATVDVFLELTSESSWGTSHPHYFFDFRFVDIANQSPLPGEQLTITGIAARAIYGLTIDPAYATNNESALDLLDLWLANLVPESPPLGMGVNGEPGLAGRIIGAYLGLPKAPKFSQSQPPSIPTPVLSFQTAGSP